LYKSNVFIKNIYVNEGYYATAKHLIESINKSMKEYNISKHPFLSYNEINNKITIFPGVNDGIKFFPSFGKEIENILGIGQNSQKINYNFVNNRIDKYTEIFTYNEFDENYEGEYPVEITRGYHSLYIYTNIVYPSYVGDTYSQLLRVVEIPRNSKFGDQIVIKYDKPQYRNLLEFSFEMIDIAIKDDCNELIPFKFGRVIITLHFKKL